MSDWAIIAACAISLLMLLAFFAWTRSVAFMMPGPASAKGFLVSYTLLALFVVIPLFNESRDASALVQEGLSAGNKAEAVLALAAFAWAIWLLASGAVRLSTLRAGINFWIACLISLYGLSTFWSLWPALTAYRTIELSGFWIVTVHLFSGRPPLARLIGCLLVAGLVILVGGALMGTTEVQAGHVFGHYRSNQLGLLAGCLLVLLFARALIFGRRRGLILLLPAFIIFVLAGSLGSLIALCFACAVLVAFRLLRLPGKVAQVATVAYFLPLAAVFAYQVVLTDPGAVAWIAAISGKNTRNVVSATGRADLWRNLWSHNADNIIGTGFGTDRLLYKILPSQKLGFDAKNTEDGYISAWIGAGWPAAWITVFIFAGAMLIAFRRPYQERALILPLILFLAINNFSYAGVGGIFHTAWFVMMVVACAGPELPVRITVYRPRPAGIRVAPVLRM